MKPDEAWTILNDLLSKLETWQDNDDIQIARVGDQVVNKLIEAQDLITVARRARVFK